jgi:hypothetical protein
MKRAHLICVVIALAAALLTLTARDSVAASPEFSKYDLRGTYIVTYSGVTSSGQLESGFGIYTSDGLGNITGTETFNSGGTVCQNVSITATYNVVANGTGTLHATYTSPTPGCSGQYNDALILFDGANSVRAVSIDPSFVTVSEEWRRQPE